MTARKSRAKLIIENRELRAIKKALLSEIQKDSINNIKVVSKLLNDNRKLSDEIARLKVSKRFDEELQGL